MWKKVKVSEKVQLCTIISVNIGVDLYKINCDSTVHSVFTLIGTHVHLFFYAVIQSENRVAAAQCIQLKPKLDSPVFFSSSSVQFG